MKWDVSDTLLEEGEDYLIYHFDTPWGPPEGIHAMIRDEFPDISMSWFFDEPGMQMAGYLGAERW